MCVCVAALHRRLGHGVRLMCACTGGLDEWAWCFWAGEEAHSWGTVHPLTIRCVVFWGVDAGDPPSCTLPQPAHLCARAPRASRMP